MTENQIPAKLDAREVVVRLDGRALCDWIRLEIDDRFKRMGDEFNGCLG